MDILQWVAAIFAHVNSYYRITIKFEYDNSHICDLLSQLTHVFAYLIFEIYHQEMLNEKIILCSFWCRHLFSDDDGDG